MNCGICNGSFITENSKYYAHKINTNGISEEHYMCENCLKEFLRICSCDKKLNEDPKKLVNICPCNITKYFIDINPQYIEFLLIKHSDEYSYIPSCKGCCYSKEQIESDILIATRNAIDSCVFKTAINNKYKLVKYEGDSLNEDFVDYCKEHLNINLTANDI